MQQHTTKQSILNKLDEFTRDITGLGNPIILGALGLLIYGWTQNTLTLYLIWIANEVFCSLIKYYAPTARPIPMQYTTWIERIEAGSFPSIHSSRWMVLVGFALAEGVTQANSAVFFVLSILAILVGVSRVILRKHYWRDVLAGWLIGFLFGWLIGQV